MAILVTGGAGFIGSSLLDRLAARDDDLICWDDLNDYYDPQRKRKNIAALLDARRIRLIEGDICDRALGEKVFAGGKIETVVHLAARAGVRPSLKDPLLYERVNCGGTAALLDLARRHGVKKFVFGSSSSVYGNSDPERDIPTLIEHMAAGRLDPSPLVTHRISLADVTDAFERMQRGEGGRSVVVMHT